jgi:hypothetical protein
MTFPFLLRWQPQGSQLKIVLRKKSVLASGSEGSHSVLGFAVVAWQGDLPLNLVFPVCKVKDLNGQISKTLGMLNPGHPRMSTEELILFHMMFYSAGWRIMVLGSRSKANQKFHRIRLDGKLMLTCSKLQI